MESKLVGFCYCVSHLVAKLLGRGLFTWLQLSKDGLLHGKPGIVRCCHKVCGSVHSCDLLFTWSVRCCCGRLLKSGEY